MLHILRSETDETTRQLMAGMAHEAPTVVVRLHDADPDWDQIIEQIFSHEKIICWW
jgi:hypothetical protein